MNSRSFEKYKIENVYRFLELKNFALQYPQWVAAASELPSISSPALDGLPHGTDISDPTGNTASLRLRNFSKIRIVESAATLCHGDPYMQKLVLKGVTTEGCTFAWLYSHGYAHCDKMTYYMARRRFYWHLDRLVE